MTYDIVVGIPSYNEGKNISFVAEQVDLGLQKYYPNKKAIIINVDGGSADSTRKYFLNAKTKTEKKSFCRKGVSGKGNVFKMLFEFLKEHKVKAAIVVDSDLKSINPEWVKLMLGPVFKGYDYCTPLYSRHKYDGTITNNIVYPIVYGLFGMDIRQPIGGDFSFSGRMANYWLKQEWRKSTGQFGIDNFMTTSAIMGNFKICQIGLGAKVHKSSAPNLGRMFIEVIDTLFSNTLKSKKFISRVSKVKSTPVFGIKLGKPQNLKVNKAKIRKKAVDGIDKFSSLYKKVLSPEVLIDIRKNISKETWCAIVYTFLKEFKRSHSRKLIEALSYLYFMRVCSFIEETEKMSSERTEKKIKEQAEIFFKRRKFFLK
ncbi:MAG: hypothetical protein QF506_00630 [Candidatus Woesearchaeota archaeon]|jgi:glycosyltransferase involved in cell wall biosynthesis|nr:hypothetical protein [Candidatus Woesearchaeota archaeon]|tara:strand:- start:750 stop:1862 length:1113 start_codon:yes stop_codon:yes gene_type:complete